MTGVEVDGVQELNKLNNGGGEEEERRRGREREGREKGEGNRRGCRGVGTRRL